MRSQLHCLTTAAGLAAALLFSSVASAEVTPYPTCERDPTDSDVSAAKGAYEAGQVSFQEADYDRALLYWEDAFRRDCTAVKLLLNIARAYELSGDRSSAVNSLQTYVDRRPDAKDRDSVEKRIAKLKETIAAEQLRAEAAAANEPDQQEKDPVQREETTPPPTTDTAPKSSKPVWPVLLSGSGIVIALVGHAIAAKGQMLQSDVAAELGCDRETKECDTDAQTEQVNEAGQAERNVGTPIALGGHILGIGGGVLWWILWTNGGPESATKARPNLGASAFRPVLSPGYQGLSFSGTF